ncbi:PREDICTED: autophagy-related protein 13 [Fragaria vesca subsp. vesca]|uniref:autophagy-related protein 13 n=1 Tax=Fragaria vesca subsp. vesca TaxID=101020 RepID=UPI0002C376C8|nr:PREDICTED: autophagy-related protein 13 [Fragaria vesca subsp. vesca]XP_011468868.1 PREDICTED: autophagy-related protein 13 [Fragaria vesca subsp. vesca]XP_011468869.1 PREDICTED: autophagy-related protein 13 [Fragaria vesca subsp. vesca]
MASSHGNTHSEAEIKEQIITEFYAKSLQIILESRTPYMSSRNYSGEQGLSSPSSSSSSSSSVRPRDKWFNLALRECPAALENLVIWRQSNFEPMVVDVVLVQRPVGSDSVESSPKRNLSLKERYPNCWNYEQEDFWCEAKSEKIIERWVLHYDTRRTRETKSGSRRSSNSTLQMLYKKSILLLRSLYVTLRLLPAYKIYRDLNSSGQILPFTLAHRVASFAEPFTCREDAEMQRFEFTPVDTACGRLCLSVLYCSSLSDVSSEPSTPMSPQVIPDYVGSPLADPLKRFPSLPVSGSLSRATPSSSPFSRRHSWSYDHGADSPPSISFSPSPTHSEPHASISHPRSRHFPPTSLPRYQPGTSLDHKKDIGFYEYYPSPGFSPALSPSATPSLPISIPGNHVSNNPVRSESAPFSAPVAKHASSPASSQKLNFPPSPPLRSTKTTVGTAVEKLLSFGKGESRQCSGLKISSSSSQQISFSRSSTRSFPDDFDDSEYPCPFDYDDDVTDPGSRPESFDQRHEPGGLFPITKSQDAAVGALVRMLKKAPPLQQEVSDSVSLSQDCRPEIWSDIKQEANLSSERPAPGHPAHSSSVISSGLVTSKTTADALEELRGYRDMKNLLLAQSTKFHT